MAPSPLHARSLAMLLAAGSLALPEAMAQQSTAGQQMQEEPASTPTELDTVIVTGQRQAQREAIQTKRETFAVSDVVASDDIGKLPDHNTAAALQRVPGVAVWEDQGEPREPIIRGLTSTYNRTTIDGALVSSVSEEGRNVPLDIVPSVMADRIEVIKTVTPDQDANAIGGIINIVTRSAFSTGQPFLDATGSLGFAEQHGDVRNDKQPYRVNFAAGRLFGADDQFGIVVSASDEQLDYDIPQVESASPSVREYTAAGAPVDSGSALGNGIQVPTQRRLFWYNNTKNRSGLNAKLEWRPNPDFKWDTSAAYNTMEDDEERIENRLEPIGNVANQTATSGDFASGRQFIQLNLPDTERSIWLGRSAVEWTAAERLKVSGDVIYSRAELDQTTTAIEFRTPTGTRARDFGFSYDTSDFYPIFTPYDQAAARDPANYRFQQYRDTQLDSIEESQQARLDLEYDNGGLENFFKLKFGGVARFTDRELDQDRITYSTRSGFNWTLDSVSRAGPDKLIKGRYLLSPRIDYRAANDFLNANIGNFNAALDNIGSDFTVSEDVYAGYGQATIKRGPFTVIAGMRYERTEVDTDSTRASDDVYLPVSDSGSYHNWLPGLHLRYDATDNLVLRAAWTNTIGRPDFADITANSSINFDGSVAVLTRGNPSLKPRESEGFDLSLEYYLDEGLVALGLFRKRIDNEIFTLTSNVEMDLGIGRGVEMVQVQQPMNAQSAKITGAEVAWQQTLSFLPAPFDGLGFNLNATFLDTEFAFITSAGLRETGLYMQPDVITNAALFYQYGPVEFRVSHNYLGGFLETINDTIPNADQYWKGRHTYDASVDWQLSDRLTVFVQGQNLSDTGRREVTGPGKQYLQESADYGRTYWVGLSGHF